MIKSGIELIAEERREQIEKHGRSIERDVKENTNGQLPYAASVLIDNDLHPLSNEGYRPTGWDRDIWNKMWGKSYEERLIIAGALIAAEIDRIQYNQ